MNTTKKELNYIKELVKLEDERNQIKYPTLSLDYFVVELFYYENTNKVDMEWVYSPANVSEAFDRLFHKRDKVCTIAKKRHTLALISKEIEGYRVVKLIAQNKQEDIML